MSIKKYLQIHGTSKVRVRVQFKYYHAKTEHAARAARSEQLQLEVVFKQWQCSTNTFRQSSTHTTLPFLTHAWAMDARPRAVFPRWGRPDRLHHGHHRRFDPDHCWTTPALAGALTELTDLSTSTVYTLVNCTNEDQYKYTYDGYPNKVHITPGFDSWILYYNISCSDRAIHINIFHDTIYYTRLRA